MILVPGVANSVPSILMRRTPPARVPPRPASLAFEPLESRELLAADAACWPPCVFPVADDSTWTFDDSWVAADPFGDPTGVLTGISPGSDGLWDGAWWVDDASFGVAYATGFDVVDPVELGGVAAPSDLAEPGEVTVGEGMDAGWFFEPFATADGDIPVIPFLPPPDAVEAAVPPIAVMRDALPAAPDVGGSDSVLGDVVRGAAAADAATNGLPDAAPTTASATASQPAAATAGAGRFAGWGAFALQALGGTAGTADGTATGGVAEGQPGSGRPRLRLPFRPAA